MSNSALVSLTRTSPNKTSPRNHKIDTITIHCVVGQLTPESIGAGFADPARKASSNYGVGCDGRIGLYVDECDRSWCTGGVDGNGKPIRVNGISGADNDHRAITIEVASDTTYPYAVRPAAYEALIKLCADICRRNGIDELCWENDKTLVGKPERQNMTVHRWFCYTECPGEWLYSRMGQIADDVNAILTEDKTAGTQATELASLSTDDFIKKVGPMVRDDAEKSGIRASVTMAQMILESGWAKGELPKMANNMFSMHAQLSGNSWPGSAWDGTIYNMPIGGRTEQWRKYSSVEQSIADHSAYLLGAKVGNRLRYDGLTAAKSCREAAKILKDNGYATDAGYVDKLCNLIERYRLDEFDEKAQSVPFCVKVDTGADIYSQPPSSNDNTGKGIFTIVEVDAAGRFGRLKSGRGWISLQGLERAT